MAQETTHLSKFQTKATSAARAKLAETIAARAAVDSKLAELTAASAKLDSQIADVAPVQEAIAALDEAEDFAALKWARGESADRPQPDIEARDRLARELAAASASAASAARAKSTIAAQMTAEAGKTPDIERYATAAIVEILCEEAAPLVAELKAAAVALAVKIKSLEYVSGHALEIAEKGRYVPGVSATDHELANLGAKEIAIQHADPANATPPEAHAAAIALLAKFSIRHWAPIATAIVEATESFPAVLEGQTAAVAEWRTLKSELRSDSGVRFAGAK